MNTGKRNKHHLFFGVMKKTICFLLAGLLCAGLTFADGSREAKAAGWPAGPNVGAASAIVMEANTGTILYTKDCHSKRYPASITKILTTLLALENCDLDETVTFSEDAVYKTEGSGIYRNVGEQMSLKDTLYAVMLESANECAYATAEHVADGDYDAFVQMMNDRAAELGCQDSTFRNPHGLPDEQHLTSAYDMALIATEAIQNDMFRTITGTKRYELPATNKSEPLVMLNHHKMITNHITAQYLYEDCIGGKTGFTQAARNTLVTYAERDGMLLVCVVLKCEGTTYEDTTTLFNYCFDNFQAWSVADHETRYSSDVEGSSTLMTQNEPFAQLDENATIILPKGVNFLDTETEVTYEDDSPDAMGSLIYRYDGRQVGQVDIVKTGAKVDLFDFAQGSKEDVDPSDLAILQGEITQEEPNMVGTIVIIIVIIALAIFLFFVIRAHRHRRRWQNHRHPNREYVRIRNKKRRRRGRRY